MRQGNNVKREEGGMVATEGGGIVFLFMNSPELKYGASKLLGHCDQILGGGPQRGVGTATEGKKDGNQTKLGC